MKIVHIGSGTSVEEIAHIAEQREAGHDYFVPGANTYEQTVRRIMDADEIHVFDITREFELGLVYFFSVEALHHKLHWRIVIFDTNDGGPSAAWFRRVAADHTAAADAVVEGRWQLVESMRLGENMFVPVAADTTFVSKIKSKVRAGLADKQNAVEIVMGEGGAKFELACNSALQICANCSLEEKCQELLLKIEDQKNRE